MDNLANIKKTIGGFEVKNLRYIKQDNVIVGQVKDPSTLTPNLHGGFISCTWTRQGKPLKINKDRPELNLVIPK